MSAHSGLIYSSLLNALLTFMMYALFYSAKMANKIETILKPLLGPNGKYEGKVKVIVRLQVQPWHASSTLTHEAGLAVSLFNVLTLYIFSLFNSCFFFSKGSPCLS